MTKPQSIILNDRPVSSEEILRQISAMTSKAPVPEWEKELLLFLNEWFSDSDFIRAQTSGSTGAPKPIELSKNMMIKSAERTIGYFGLKKGDRLLLSLSCRYIAGKMMVVRAIEGQMNLITTDPSGDFHFLKDKSFDFGAMVPNQIYKLLEQPSGIEKLQNIRNLLIGGSSISQELEAQISKLSNRVVLTYGMTETASHIAIRELSGKYRSGLYRCLPGITVGLRKDGCLQIHLPEIENTLQTNDLAELQSDSGFRILGRADSVIISGGIKFSPEIVEKRLEQELSIRFVISSLPDEKLGEKLVLVLEGKPFATADLEQKLSKLLTDYQRPKTICFLNEFPETSSGKVMRDGVKRQIREQAS